MFLDRNMPRASFPCSGVPEAGNIIFAFHSMTYTQPLPSPKCSSPSAESIPIVRHGLNRPSLRGLIAKFFASLAALLLFAGAASAQHFDGLAVTGSYKINSLWPESFSSIKGVVTVKMSNTGGQRLYKDVRAVLYRSGTAFLDGTCNDIVVAKGESEVVINGRASLCGVSIFTVLGSALLTDLSAYTADLYFTDVAPDGTAVKVVRQGVPLSNYLKR